MKIEEIYKYAYIKKPLHEIYSSPKLVPPEFILEWFKDAFDYQRLHSDEELLQFMSLKQKNGLKRAL